MNNSSLFDDKTFYAAFLKDLNTAKSEIIIESPFITKERTEGLIPVINRLLARNVKIYIFTRDPKEHDQFLETQSEDMITEFERIGIQVFLCLGNHHRKLAIIDRNILWEGSLNILSQYKSREIMRRIDDGNLALEMFNFLKFWRFISL
ncbi:MAG TPA: phospholipase D-like domain-containing protein [Candidatus Sulfotelmatobacter sp.]|nr:phospholipase D-like domain-containing protein [Candidatus Sulfotelmatobacter sp.]